MEPTLVVGDDFLLTKFSCGYSRYALPLGESHVGDLIPRRFLILSCNFKIYVIVAG
ncbi:hypothetical protein [Bradyrhizobium sp.]|uniref:hypothetical protein n=1 Tax=Bradyrhizobium sp. TaxID=376 RepID=UPI003C718604